MKYFLDTEFIEDGRTIDLISIAIVAEDGRELYVEMDQRDVDYERADQWVKKNVIAHLWSRLPFNSPEKAAANAWHRDGGIGGLLRKTEIALEVVAFCSLTEGDKPEFWGYYADYDWVVLCQLFGRMIDLPKGWPMYCRDLKQLCDSVGNPKLTKQEHEHHALADARWIKQQYELLSSR